jgi:nucleotide-binding universal stress UspA family protein
MFRNILIPIDGSDLAAKAVEQGVLFAKEIGAKITAVTVTEPFHFLSVSPSQLEYTPIEYRKYSKDHAEKVLGVVSDAAKLACVVCDTLHVEHEQVYQAIIEAAEARKCDAKIGDSPRHARVPSVAPICSQQRAPRRWLIGPPEDRNHCGIAIISDHPHDRSESRSRQELNWASNYCILT